LTGASPAASALPPTFNADVAPILDRDCVNCHRAEGNAAALPLTTYEAARRLGVSIKQQVSTRQMPPWPADDAHSLPFANDRRLAQPDIDTLSAWVDAGMPRGEGAGSSLATAAPHWEHPRRLPPDLVISLPEVVVPANGEMPYVIRRIKVPIARDQWVAAMQVRPGNPALVHHMGITEITLSDGMSAADAEAFAKLAQQLGAASDALDTTKPTVSDPFIGNAYDMLGVYTPGSTFEMYGDDSGKLLKAGQSNYLNFNVHYATIGVQASDRSQLALWFARSVPAHQLIRSPAAVETIIANGRQLLADDPGTQAEGTYVAIPPIPPNARNYEIIGMTAYTRPVTLYQLQPHAHMRGKDFTYSVIYPDGREQTVLSVPQFDFHWQLAYDLETPLTLPAGSKLVVTAHYDNSSDNAHLRDLGQGELARNCGPDKVAYFRRQNQSWHEMFSPIVQYSVDALPARMPRAKLVEVIGCLAASPAHLTLQHAGTLATTFTQSTSASEVVAHSVRKLGNGRYDLVGARFFNTEASDGHKVIVKGVLSGEGGKLRINVTSLQTSADCSAMSRAQ
jgi:hypothetical protein